MSLFLPNIPQPNDNLDFSQGQLLSNNQGLDTVFSIDHTLFSDASSDKGFHRKVTFPVVVAPGSTPLHLVEYMKTIAGNSELFMQRDGIATEIQLTSGSAGQGNSVSYWQSFIPGGLQVRMGIDSGDTTIPINYAARGLNNFPTNSLFVFIIGAAQQRTYSASALANTGFTANTTSAGGASFYWLAFGY